MYLLLYLLRSRVDRMPRGVEHQSVSNLRTRRMVDSGYTLTSWRCSLTFQWCELCGCRRSYGICTRANDHSEDPPDQHSNLAVKDVGENEWSAVLLFTATRCIRNKMFAVYMGAVARIYILAQIHMHKFYISKAPEVSEYSLVVCSFGRISIWVGESTSASAALPLGSATRCPDPLLMS